MNTGSDETEEKPRRLTRAETKARTRRLLLDATARTFARKGFAGSSVEEIAEAAGYSIGAVYANFGSKEQMFIELMKSRVAEHVERAGQIMDGVENGTVDPTKELGRLLTRTADEDPDFAPLQAEFWLYAVRNPEMMSALAEQLRGPHDLLTEQMGRALDRVGGRDEVPAESVATVVLALFQGLARQRRLDPATVPDDLYVQAVRWMLYGIGASARGLVLPPPTAPAGREPTGSAPAGTGPDQHDRDDQEER